MKFTQPEIYAFSAMKTMFKRAQTAANVIYRQQVKKANIARKEAKYYLKRLPSIKTLFKPATKPCKPVKAEIFMMDLAKQEEPSVCIQEEEEQPAPEPAPQAVDMNLLNHIQTDCRNGSKNSRLYFAFINGEMIQDKEYDEDAFEREDENEFYYYIAWHINGLFYTLYIELNDTTLIEFHPFYDGLLKITKAISPTGKTYDNWGQSFDSLIEAVNTYVAKEHRYVVLEAAKTFYNIWIEEKKNGYSYIWY